MTKVLRRVVLAALQNSGGRFLVYLAAILALGPHVQVKVSGRHVRWCMMTHLLRMLKRQVRNNLAATLYG